MIISNIRFRENVLSGDELKVEEIVRSTGFFSEDEISIARELVEERLAKGIESGYFFLFAEVENEIVGYTCFGPIPATKHSFDLYWIAVHSNFRGKGIGKILNVETEKIIAGMGGHNVYAETSGRGQYEPTRAFYVNNGYTEGAVLEDFYAPGDAKYIYVKSV
ncbi:MAG: GNAT family N-acetyltransferase [Ignavibacteria bacterium]|nr:GNAT family N-acetyltransferase [Ignavibacteria bacterium]